MDLSPEQLKEIEEYISTLPEEERESKLKEIEDQIKENKQCPFCLMIENKIQTTRVYDNQYFMAVLEINPANKGHIILFSKRHAKDLASLNEDEMEYFGKAVKKLQSALLSLYNSSNIIISDGVYSGNKFEHFVVNLIPRKKDDFVNISWKPNKSDEKELSDVQRKIIEAIPIDKIKEEIKPLDLELKRKYFP